MAEWKIDPDHTAAAFSVRHFMITLVRGQFNMENGGLVVGNDLFLNLEVEADLVQ
jgi:polyisoprenoid-binding protein YceI